MMKTQPDKKNAPKNVTEKNLTRRSFIAFAGFAGLYAAGYGAWKLLYNAPIETRGITGGAHKPLRKALNNTELAFRKTFSNNHLVKTYPKWRAEKQVRVNSVIGMKDRDFDTSTWSLNILKSDGSHLAISLPEIMALPQTEIIYDFKCVEGWDQISWWGGVRFSDFIKHYQLEDQAKLEYAGFTTPDKLYYVGIDMQSAMHPQTLLAYKVNGRLLPYAHGAPLRLIIPVKYGIKNLKRIGNISFSNQRPPDYWAERGYDYYSGL